MQALLGLSRAIDAFTAFVGRYVSWLIVLAVLISAINAVVRKVFDMSSNAYLELQWVLFSAVFLLCAPWTLLQGEHIKIDIINHTLPLKVRSWIDMLGHIFFLVPFCIIMLYMAVPFFLTSYHQNEQSFSAGGLPQWPAKSLIMFGFTLLLIQAVSEIIKRAAIMKGLLPDPNKGALSAHEIAELEALKLAQAITIDPERSVAPIHKTGN